MICWLTMPYSESFGCVMFEIPCWTSKLDRWIDAGVLCCKCSLGYVSRSGCSLRYISWLQNVSSTSYPVILVKIDFQYMRIRSWQRMFYIHPILLFSTGGYSLNTRKTLRDSRFKVSASGDHVLPVIFPEYTVSGGRRVRGGHSVSPTNIMFTLRNLTTIHVPAWNIGTRYKSEFYSIYLIETRWIVSLHSLKSVCKGPLTLG